MKSYIFGTDHPNLLLWLYMLWFNFILGLNFISLCFKLIIIDNHTPKQRKIKFKPRVKLNHNIYKDKIITKCNHAPKTVLRINKIMNFGATWA